MTKKQPFYITFFAPILRCVVLAFVLTLSQSQHSAAAEKIVFGWVTFQDTKWPAPYSGGNIPADSLPWEVLTHVGLFAPNGSNPLNQTQYINQFGAFTARAHQSGVFAGMTVGGSGDAALVTMIGGGQASWLSWINHYLTYVDAHKMDFIDFDLEGSYSAANIGGFFSLLYDSLQVRKGGLDPSRPPYIVFTAGVSRAISSATSTIMSKVEFVNLMTYDYNNNAWNRVTFDNSPKSYKYNNGTGGATDSVGTGVNAIAPSMQRMAIRVNQAGWPMNKLTVGMDFNGGGWNTASQIRQSTSGTSSGGSNATFANQWSTWKNLPADSIFFDQVAQAYWARVGTGLYTWLTLPGRDSGVIATRKVVDSMGIGGVCIWNLGNEVWNTPSGSTPPGGKGWFFSQMKQHLNFGGTQPPPPPPPPDVPKIKGKVFFDANQNNALDAGELPVAGRRVSLSGTQTKQTLTDSSGEFRFEQLPLGNYTVSLNSRTQWSQTFPAGGANHTANIDTIDRVVDVDFGTHSSTAFRFPANRFWNIVSMPVVSADMSTSAIYPLALTPAYSFHGQYATADVLTPGEGYWIKFNFGHDVWVAGTGKFLDSVAVVPGWNFIGSIAEPIPISNLRTIPPDILSPYVYGYGGGSFLASQIQPGSGYWVHSSDSGMVVLSNTGLSAPESPGTSARSGEELSGLTFIAASGERQSLHFTFNGDETRSLSAPPAPPDALFSARFRSAGASGSVLEILQASVPLPIIFGNASYPMAIEWSVLPGDGDAVLRAGGLDIVLEGKGRVEGFEPGGSGPDAATILLVGSNDNGNSVPPAYNLEQNYPNPFNGSTVINFSIPEVARVKLEVFNVLGEKLLTLVDGSLSPGLHTATLRGDDLPSGIYLYRLTGDNSAGPNFSTARKLAHIK